MTGLIESATAILSRSESRLEVIAHNVANISTPGFKRQTSFLKLIKSPNNGLEQKVAVRHSFEQGKIIPSTNPFDIAISGPGFFQLRAGDSMIYSRQGQFTRSTDGTVVTPQGYALQQAEGGDLVIDGPSFSVLQDGTVLDNGVPVARLAAFAVPDPASLEPMGDTAFTLANDTMEVVSDPVFRQGMTENSNVAIGDEMVAMMATLRQSESGARLVQVYDELLGRAFSTLGQSGK